MGIPTKIVPRPGQRFILTVRPLDWYAGSVGAGAVIEEVSESAVYVLFDGGLRESFPPARFVEYFRPEVSATPPGADPRDGHRRDLSHR